MNKKYLIHIDLLPWGAIVTNGKDRSKLTKIMHNQKLQTPFPCKILDLEMFAGRDWWILF